MNRRIDNRVNKRIKLTVPCLTYKDNIEYDCVIHDISRNGISFKFDRGVEISDIIQFTFLFGNAIVTGAARIVNIRYIDNGMICGCRLRSIRPYDFVEGIEIRAAVYMMLKKNVYYSVS